MNEQEHLLAVIIEEAGEVIQAATKALRFGLDDGYPGTERTNRGDLVKEYSELRAAWDMLSRRGVIGDFDADAYAKKSRRVRAYMEHARSTGALLPEFPQASGDPDRAK